MSKATGIHSEIYDYMLRCRSADDPVLEALRKETHDRFGRSAGMQISPDQGTFLKILVVAMGARRAIEIGTFTGYSGLEIARGLGPEGRLLACDISQEWTSVARRYWEQAGVSDRIELRLAPALETLGALPEDESFDFAFIDADKANLLAYYEGVLGHLRPGGLIAIDNVLWGGRVVRAPGRSDDEDTLRIRELNEFVADDPRVDAVMLAVADGLTLARKRPTS